MSMCAIPRPAKSRRNFRLQLHDRASAQAVPKMIPAGRRLDFVRAEKEDDKAKWLTYDTRHMLAEITPKPDQVTVAIGSSRMT